MKRAFVECELEAQVDVTLLERPTAIVPVAMALAALSIVVAYAWIFGTARQADEGTAAHQVAAALAAMFPVWWFQW